MKIIIRKIMTAGDLSTIYECELGEVEFDSLRVSRVVKDVFNAGTDFDEFVDYTVERE